MNLKSAQTLVRNASNHRLILVKRDGEYCVKVRGRRNDVGSYFTNDIQDAVNTAYAMLNEKPATGWAKGDDLVADCFYVVGIMRDTRELVIAAGPYTRRIEAHAEATGFDAPEYCAVTTMEGCDCKGLRTWEDFV